MEPHRIEPRRVTLEEAGHARASQVMAVDKGRNERSGTRGIAQDVDKMRQPRRLLCAYIVAPYRLSYDHAADPRICQRQIGERHDAVSVLRIANGGIVGPKGYVCQALTLLQSRTWRETTADVVIVPAEVKLDAVVQRR